MSDNSIKPYIVTGAAIGGLSGAGYGFTHPSAKSLSKIESLKPEIYETMQINEVTDSHDELIDMLQEHISRIAGYHLLSKSYNSY